MDRIHITPSTSVVLAPRRDGDGHSEVLAARGSGNSIAAFCKKSVVLIVATVAAAVSCFFVAPDEGYLDYFDWRTLVSLLCMLAVVAAL